jgi:hypothetical protein
VGGELARALAEAAQLALASSISNPGKRVRLRSRRDMFQIVGILQVIGLRTVL